MIFLEDDAIRIRAVEPSDADLMWSIEKDSSQWLENGLSAPYSRENLIRYASTYSADPYSEGQLRLVIEGKSEQYSVYGLLDIYDLSAKNHTAFVGIYILPEFRRRNIALNTLKMCENYVLNLLNIRILAAKVIDTNTGSATLFEKAGYKKVGVLKSWIQTGKEFHDMLIYEKLL